MPSYSCKRTTGKRSPPARLEFVCRLATFAVAVGQAILAASRQ
jgi:hypothetical protein